MKSLNQQTQTLLKMKPKDFKKWYNGLNGKKFERISKPKTEEELKSKLLIAQLGCAAISYSVCYN